MAKPRYKLVSPFADLLTINKEKKYLLIKNNLHTNNINFIKKIDADFKSVVGENLRYEYSPLEFDINRPIMVTPYFRDLLAETYSADFDYVIFLTFVRKPNDSMDIGKKAIEIIEKSIVTRRHYHVLLRVIDLKTKQIVYAKEAISNYNKSFSTGITTSQMKQLEDTYMYIFKDFANRK